MNPYLFMVGCPKSGTTLLRRLVDAHPRITIPTSEQHWLVKWYERGRGVTPEGEVSPDLIPELLSYKKFARIGLGRTDLERAAGKDGPVAYPQFVSRVFDLYARSRGKPLAGDTERFEATAGDLLEELGYPRAFPTPGLRTRKHSSKIRTVLAKQGSL